MHAVHTCLLGWVQSEGLFLPVNRSIQFWRVQFRRLHGRSGWDAGVLEGLVVVTLQETFPIESMKPTDKRTGESDGLRIVKYDL